MSYPASGFGSLRSVLLLASAALAAVAGWSGGAHAQATGQVDVATTGTGAARGLESLQRLILAPPEPQLNLLVAPSYSTENYDSYQEPGFFFNAPSGDPTFGRIEDAFQVPEFRVNTAGIFAGTDYLFANGLFVGAGVTYNNVDFNFDEPAPATRQRQILGATSQADIFAAAGAGDPVDREFDEYGGTIAFGYLTGPLTLLLTGGYSYRDIDTRRREFNSVVEFSETEGDFDSDRYSVEFGASYRFDFEEGSLQPFASIGYSREEVDGYLERFAAGFQDLDLDGSFERAPAGAVTSTARRFNDQTIESIPLTAGMLFSIPLGAETDQGAAGRVASLGGLTAGLSYTHDFEDQERTIISESVASPDFSTRVEEENRNQDYLTLLGSLDFNLFERATTTFTFEQDIGFDERELASTIRLQLRVPL